jgi:phage shock protein A
MRDIVHSNINTMLEKAEDPEKLIKLMIQEMEDTLVEIKSSCAGAMATRKKVGRSLETVQGQVEKWNANAELAVRKGREDLAREALLERRRYQEEVDSLTREAAEADGVVEQYKEDIDTLEKKLATAREKHRVLIERHISATQRRHAREQVRKSETTDAFARFEDFQNRIERMEADADLAGRQSQPTLDEEFKNLEDDEELESELAALKRSVDQNG